ncbi:hypothetical protein LOCC1_G007882 [Lachnellula occidentalis]|uniref:Uncharacterized protein n=1 Tax=Lachnellula occidentalis TaxID=215460 RepID=A0A8H8U5Y5_9HELO|nr:hypothetical protein LOCC1_G007882 [Lachnellula occidentalis]
MGLFSGASFFMAPAGWHIQERIGWQLWVIHGAAAIWDTQLRKAMQKYAAIKMKKAFDICIRFFLGLKGEKPVQPNCYFLKTDNMLFQQEPSADSLPYPSKIEDVHIRHETQKLRRFPRSGAGNVHGSKLSDTNESFARRKRKVMAGNPRWRVIRVDMCKGRSQSPVTKC